MRRADFKVIFILDTEKERMSTRGNCLSIIPYWQSARIFLPYF